MLFWNLVFLGGISGTLLHPQKTCSRKRNWETKCYALQCWEGAASLQFSTGMHRNHVRKDPEFYALLVLNCKEGSTLPALEGCKNQSLTGTEQRGGRVLKSFWKDVTWIPRIQPGASWKPSFLKTFAKQRPFLAVPPWLGFSEMGMSDKKERIHYFFFPRKNWRQGTKLGRFGGRRVVVPM